MKLKYQQSNRIAFLKRGRKIIATAKSIAELLAMFAAGKISA